MSAMNRYQKAIGIVMLGLLVSIIVQVAAAANTDAITISCAVIPHQVPGANFTADITSGTAPLTVHFTDTSLNSPVSWLWDFGDGTTSTEQNPMHTYESGVFTVSLTATYTTRSSQVVKLNYIHVSMEDSGGGDVNPSTEKGGMDILSVPILEQDLFAPPQEDVKVTETLDIGVQGVSVTSSPTGQLTLTIVRSEAEKTGAVITSEKTVEIVQPGFTLVIVVEQLTEKNGIITGQNIASITLTTTPLEASISDVGPVSVSIQAGLSSLPAGAKITTSLSDPVNPHVLNTFKMAMTNERKEILGVAYTFAVVKTSIGTTLPATITMTCPVDWVNNHGGKEAVAIVRIGDDGSTQVLETRFVGFDKKGRMIFEGHSPPGLSLFGLLTAKAAVVEQEENPNATVAVSSKSAMATNVEMFSWLISSVMQNPVIMVIGLAVLALAAYFGWWKRRL